MNALVLMMLAIVPREDVTRERCDCIEVNSYYDDNGALIFTQTIFMDFCRERSIYLVRGWRMVKDGKPLPEYDHDAGDWKCRWVDGEIPRCVSAASYRRTWTQPAFEGDPERNNLDVWPKEYRRELIKDVRGLTKRPVYDVPSQ